jgi:transcriptional regulator with XRE-family HTH domain
LGSTRTTDYVRLLKWLKRERRSAGVSQQELAKRVKRPQSYVSKCETGERRLDVVEFAEWTRAIQVDPARIFSEVLHVPETLKLKTGKRALRLHRK